jgi:hypothetical protein
MDRIQTWSVPISMSESPGRKIAPLPHKVNKDHLLLTICDPPSPLIERMVDALHVPQDNMARYCARVHIPILSSEPPIFTGHQSCPLPLLNCILLVSESATPILIGSHPRCTRRCVTNLIQHREEHTSAESPGET